MKPIFVAVVAALVPAHGVARAETPPRAPFTATLSNHTPLAFGMSAQDAAFALGQPLTYVRGKPGNEIYVVVRHVGGSRWSYRNDPLYLQFRGGRLAGWKGDWRRDWMWQ
jgi:hypothetical protein